MKQLIVMVASILLGIFLFRMIAGPEENSLYSNVKQLWQKELQIRTVQDY